MRNSTGHPCVCAGTHITGSCKIQHHRMSQQISQAAAPWCDSSTSCKHFLRAAACTLAPASCVTPVYAKQTRQAALPQYDSSISCKLQHHSVQKAFLQAAAPQYMSSTCCELQQHAGSCKLRHHSRHHKLQRHSMSQPNLASSSTTVCTKRILQAAVPQYEPSTHCKLQHAHWLLQAVASQHQPSNHCQLLHRMSQANFASCSNTL